MKDQRARPWLLVGECLLAVGLASGAYCAKIGIESNADIYVFKTAHPGIYEAYEEASHGNPLLTTKAKQTIDKFVENPVREKELKTVINAEVRDYLGGTAVAGMFTGIGVILLSIQYLYDRDEYDRDEEREKKEASTVPKQYGIPKWYGT